jgi:hypothetical protein
MKEYKRFYLGTGLGNAEVANEVILQLEGYGYECAFNWTRSTADYEGLPEREIEAIRQADFCVFLLPGGRGTHIEMGAAIALNKRAYVLRLAHLSNSEIPFYRLLTSIESLDDIQREINQSTIS